VVDEICERVKQQTSIRKSHHKRKVTGRDGWKKADSENIRTHSSQKMRLDNEKPIQYSPAHCIVVSVQGEKNGKWK
jgi:hypothetical protein